MNEHEWSRLLTTVEDERKSFRGEISLAEETETYWKHIRDLIANHPCLYRCDGKLRIKQYATRASFMINHD